MRVFRLGEMRDGWFIGDFSPSVLRTSDFEVAVKMYGQGDVECSHFHKIATEITLIVSGRVRMCGRELLGGDIIVLEPNESSSFEALEDAITVVVKTPSSPSDKYFSDPTS